MSENAEKAKALNYEKIIDELSNEVKLKEAYKGKLRRHQNSILSSIEEFKEKNDIQEVYIMGSSAMILKEIILKEVQPDIDLLVFDSYQNKDKYTKVDMVDISFIETPVYMYPKNILDRFSVEKQSIYTIDPTDFILTSVVQLDNPHKIATIREVYNYLDYNKRKELIDRVFDELFENEGVHDVAKHFYYKMFKKFTKLCPIELDLNEYFYNKLESKSYYFFDSSLPIFATKGTLFNIIAEK